jgi:hypothetical protein
VIRRWAPAPRLAVDACRCLVPADCSGSAGHHHHNSHLGPHAHDPNIIDKEAMTRAFEHAETGRRFSACMQLSSDATGSSEHFTQIKDRNKVQRALLRQAEMSVGTIAR